jgi:biopolymer transport protein ExbB
MYPLLFLSLVAVAVIFERFIVFGRIGGTAKGLLEGTISRVQVRDFDAALANAKESSGPVAAAILTVLEHRNRPVEAIERYVQEIGEEYFLRLERRLSVLDTITTISPLLGLLGTLVGMIGAFEAISLQQSGGNNDLILHGVAEALYATATGITIAVVCFVAYNYFTARVRQLTAQAEMAATRVLNALAEVP